MTSKHALPRVLLLALPFLVASRLQAQTSSLPSIDPAISQLAAKIADPIQEAHVTKVIFADLKGPNGEAHPVGRWLADQLANACQKNFPDLAVITRPADEATALAADGSDFRTNPPTSLEDWARRMGASVFVLGSFAKVQEGIEVTLTASTAAEQPQQIAQATGLVPITDEIISLSPQPLPVFHEGVRRAGVGGTSVPQCLHCPPPDYTSKARHDGLQGSVVLEVTITADGRATNISVKRSLSPDMDAQAVKAVSKWKFKPAIGPSGSPVPVLVPIEVTFHLYNSGF